MKDHNNKAAVFILLGQSNAVGHGVPMKDEDKITVPMKNVFGLSRELNQSFDNDTLNWTGYTSAGMNLAEQQDDTYSVANLLAKIWQGEIDTGNSSELPDLFIVHIAIGAQGITQGYMWNPEYEKILIPGAPTKVKISLYPYTLHILSLVRKSLFALGKIPEAIKMHWRGGENDVTASDAELESALKPLYEKMISEFSSVLGENTETVLHRLVCYERQLRDDPSGVQLNKMNFINSVFEKLATENEDISIFDVRNAPHYVPDIVGNGIFRSDVVHYTPEVNQWVAQQIFEGYR